MRTVQQFSKWFLFSLLSVVLLGHFLMGEQVLAQSTSSRPVNLQEYYQEYNIIPYQATTDQEKSLLQQIYTEESKTPPVVPYVVTTLAIGKATNGVAYALLSWRQGDSGGYGLYHLKAGVTQWQLLRGSGGALALERMVQAGVPQKVAKALFDESARQAKQQAEQRNRQQ